MNQNPGRTLERAQELLHDKNYSEVLLLLGGIDEGSLTREQYGYYCILHTEATVQTGSYSREYIDKAIDIFRHSSDTEKFAWAKALKGWLLSLQGRHSEAQQLLLESYVSYLRCGDLHNAAKLLNRLSYGAFQMGKIETAMENLRECVAIYDRLGDDVNRAKVAHNLAKTLAGTGRFKESLLIFSRHRPGGVILDSKAVLLFYAMHAIPHALKGDIVAAKKAIESCRPHLNVCDRERAIYHEIVSLICILDNDYDGAERALESGLEISLEIAPESALVSQIKRLFGDLYVATGKYDLAEKYATEALAVAEKINERVEIAACHRVFAQVEQQRGNSAKAREWYKKAMDLFKMIRSRYELAVTRYLAATSGLYEYGERTALLYMAREYFESEEVGHHVEKINQQLRRIQLPKRTVSKSGKLCPEVIAVSPEMKKLVALAEHVAQSEMTVLLTGATGTGKDLLARYIHYHSGREGEFVSVNTAAIPDTTVETELFGCARGAFTGSRDRVGLIEEADKGTLYLNEIANTSPEFQAKLLEVLETRVVRRLGENKKRPVDFRLIAATNQDLDQRLRDNRFRLDLYHRLNEIPIALPSLNQRKEDVLVLVRHFLTFARFDIAEGTEQEIDRLCSLLSRCSWPGNVRQLKAEIQRLLVEAKGDLVAMIELAEDALPKAERQQLLDALLRTNWNRRKAADLLGVSEGTIRRWIKKYGVPQPSGRA